MVEMMWSRYPAPAWDPWVAEASTILLYDICYVDTFTLFKAVLLTWKDQMQNWGESWNKWLAFCSLNPGSSFRSSAPCVVYLLNIFCSLFLCSCPSFYLKHGAFHCPSHLCPKSSILLQTPGAFISSFICAQAFSSSIGCNQISFYFFFWPHDMWDLIFLTRDWTCNPLALEAQSLNHWTAWEVPQANFMREGSISDEYFLTF